MRRLTKLTKFPWFSCATTSCNIEKAYQKFIIALGSCLLLFGKWRKFHYHQLIHAKLDRKVAGARTVLKCYQQQLISFRSASLGWGHFHRRKELQWALTSDFAFCDLFSAAINSCRRQICAGHPSLHVIACWSSYGSVHEENNSKREKMRLEFVKSSSSV